MASQVYQDTLEVEIGVLEAVQPDPAEGPAHLASFPYPDLIHTGRRLAATFRVVVLENDLVRAAVVPALGGRILELRDKSTGADILPRGPVLEPAKGGPRGFQLVEGLQVVVGESARPNSMGPVDVWLEDPDDDGPASVWFHERVLGTSLSFHARYSLADDSASLELEVRAFNRSLRPQAYAGGITACVGPGQVMRDMAGGGVAVYDGARQAGLAVFGDPATFDAAGYWNRCLTMGRFPQGCSEWLGPRQLDAWAMRIVPLSGLGRLDAFGRAAAMCISEGSIAVRAAEKLTNAKLVVLCDGGQTVETPIDLAAGACTELSIANLPSSPKVVAIKDARKNEVLRWDRDRRPMAQAIQAAGSSTMAALRQAQTENADNRERAYFEGLELMEQGADAASKLKRALSVPALRAAAHAALGLAALRSGDWREATARFEDALLYNGDDHLSWWMKALARRLAGDADDERPELPNAHYLAPMEPALRAEAFLRQPVVANDGPSPILKPLAGDVEAWVDVACLLLDAGLYEQAARWLDEGLRQAEEPRLRYLTAYVCLASKQMAVEARRHVELALSRPFGPSYPWQRTELRAIQRLIDEVVEPGPQKTVLANLVSIGFRFP